MKKLMLGLMLGMSLLASPVAAEDKTLSTTKFEVTENGRPLWKKLLRGTARVVTLGAVQAAADAIKANTAFFLVADHDGVDTSAYEAYVNSQLREIKPASALANGTIQFAFSTGLPKGSYTMVIKALGEGGEGVSDPLSLSVTAGNPSAPGKPRIIK